MKKRYYFLAMLVIVLGTVIFLRWPRLKPGMVVVTRCEVDGDQMVLECRMRVPFQVVLRHGIRQPMQWRDELGIQVGSSTQLRQPETEIVASAYDIVHGEHYVDLVLVRGQVLRATSNGRQIDFIPWLTPDARTAQWIPPGPVALGEGVGMDIVHFATSSAQQEYLVLWGETDATRGVRDSALG